MPARGLQPSSRPGCRRVLPTSSTTCSRNTSETCTCWTASIASTNRSTDPTGDESIKSNRPDGWHGVLAKEQTIKKSIYDVIKNVDEVERLFQIIKGITEY